MESRIRVEKSQSLSKATISHILDARFSRFSWAQPQRRSIPNRQLNWKHLEDFVFCFILFCLRRLATFNMAIFIFLFVLNSIHFFRGTRRTRAADFFFANSIESR